MRERPVSVTIFGILNIGFGLLALGGVLLSKISEDLGASAANPSVNSFFGFLDALNHNHLYVLWNAITVPLNLAAGLVMVAAGVGLLLLKNWARLVSIGCGIYKIIFVILNCAVFFLALREILANAIQGAGMPVIVLLVIVGLAAAVLTLIYPALLLYFLTRPKVILAFQADQTRSL